MPLRMRSQSHQSIFFHLHAVLQMEIQIRRMSVKHLALMAAMNMCVRLVAVLPDWIETQLLILSAANDQRTSLLSRSRCMALTLPAALTIAHTQAEPV
jgi:hypothetical protein